MKNFEEKVEQGHVGLVFEISPVSNVCMLSAFFTQRFQFKARTNNLALHFLDLTIFPFFERCSPDRHNIYCDAYSNDINNPCAITSTNGNKKLKSIHFTYFEDGTSLYSNILQFYFIYFIVECLSFAFGCG